MKNIAVLVSGGGTNLQALIDAQKNLRLVNGNIRVVLSSKAGAYALTRAKDNGIETMVVSPDDYPDRKTYSAKLVECLKAYEIDLVVLAGFMYILDHEFIQSYRNRIINVHPALIPSFCGEGYYGLRVHKAALARGVKVTGATVHFVDEVADGGPIILQKAVKVKDDDTPETLQKRVMQEAEWHILPAAVDLFCNDKIYVEDGCVRFRVEKSAEN
ncbi:MAG: phosphoribosylglycinamide formyltransferase [Ruminococcaceae bacterium]|nr:phosphoribosylglycinamide formyltransferase [Oscillospiraceae bacterium]